MIGFLAQVAQPAETESTTLRFVGDWSPFTALALALILAVVAWLLYYRESRSRPGALSWLLPSLRALAILLVALVLAGPVLHHEKTIRQLGRLFVLVDGSGSMELDDRGMPIARKASLLAASGKLESVPALSDASEAIEALSGAVIEDVEHHSQARFDREVEVVIAGIEAATLPLQSVCDAKLPFEGDLSKRGEKLDRYFTDQVINPLESFKQELAKDRSVHQLGGWVRELSRRVLPAIEDLEFIRDGTTAQLTGASGERGEQFRTAIADFDQMSRWDRLERGLFGSEEADEGAPLPLLGQLAEEQDIELIVLGDKAPEVAWWQRRAGKRKAGEMPTHFQQLPDGRATDLADGLSEAVSAGGELPAGSAVILFTDGQHNRDSSPEAVARELGETGVPVFTVGFGSTRPPLDLAVAAVEAPDSVFFEDRARGKVMVDDHLPGAARQRLEIRSGELLLWSQSFQPDGSGERAFTFDFPVRELLGEDAVETGQQVPLSLQVTLATAPQEPSEIDPTQLQAEESILANNSRDFFLQAVTRRRKVLILDASPRWETRYLKNLFDRDDQWEATVVMATTEPREGGRPKVGIPEGREQWFSYDIVILGDLPATFLTAEEQGWVADFVGKRGGGLVFLDGKWGQLAGNGADGLGELIPVRWLEETTDLLPQSLRPTALGEALGALQLAPGESTNREVWETLKPPRWIARVQALPAAEVVVEAEIEQGDPMPVMVKQRYGAGQVLYVGTDELWRWRYRAGDTYHRRFWMQVASWIGEPPFAASGERVSISSDQLVYDEGERAALRVRLRDDEGNTLETDQVEARILRDGEEFARVTLEPDPNGGGLYRGVSSAMRGGAYEVRIEAAQLSPEDVQLSFRVETPPDLELDSLSMNRGLLTAMAAATAEGRFLLEEEMHTLPALFRALDRKETITSETQLWSTWWWFIPVIVLLAVEWFLRKRGGFV